MKAHPCVVGVRCAAAPQARRMRHPAQTRYLNGFAHTLFVLLERSPAR